MAAATENQYTDTETPSMYTEEEHAQGWARRINGAGIPRLMFDPAPLVEAIRSKFGPDMVLVAPSLYRSLMRWQKPDGWIMYHTADKVCTKHLGLHPADIFGDAYWDSISEPEDGEDLLAGVTIPDVPIVDRRYIAAA